MEQLQKQLQDNEVVVIEWYSSFLSVQNKYPDCPHLINVYEKQYLNAKTVSEVIRENIQRLQNQQQQCIPPKKRKLSEMCCSPETEPVSVPISKPNKRKLTPPKRLHTTGMHQFPFKSYQDSEDSETETENSEDDRIGCPVKGCRCTYKTVGHLSNHFDIKHPNEPKPSWIEPRKVPQNTFNGVNFAMFRTHQIKHIREKYPDITFSEMMKKIGRRWARYKQDHVH